MAAPARVPPDAEGPDSYDEIVARYPDRWIALRVTTEEVGWTTEGYIVARGATDRECYER